MVKASAKKILFVTVIASLIGLPLFAQAQDKPLKKIRWGVTSISASNWIPWLAKEAKIYEKNGLDVELILLRGSGQTSVAILGGSHVCRAGYGSDVMLAALLAGADLVNVAHTVPGVQSKLLVKQEIQTARRLKGKRIATSALGSLGDFLFKYIIRKHGLDPIRDVIWLSSALRRNGFRRWSAGNVEAADLSYPTDAQAERHGLSSSLGFQERSGLSFHVYRHPAENHSGRSRHGDADGKIPC